jgi:hemoglobin
MTDYDRIGGEAGLRAIIADFVDRVFDDVMIGFIFTGKSPERLREMEFQLASEQLGGPHVYRGRDIAAVHAPLPIMGGHFLRRRKILLDTLQEHDLAEDVMTRWLAHVDALRDAVLGTGVDVEHCDHAAQADRRSPEEN